MSEAGADQTIDWPAGFERTPADHRSKNRNYDVTLAKALDERL